MRVWAERSFNVSEASALQSIRAEIGTPETNIPENEARTEEAGLCVRHYNQYK